MAEADMHVPTPKINTESSLVRQGSPSVESKAQKLPAKKPTVVKRELSFTEKLKRSFVKEDLADIRDYVIFEIVLPGIRRSFFDAIVGTAAQIFNVSIPAGLFNKSSGYSVTQQQLSPHERRYRDYNSISQANGDRYSSPTRMLPTNNRFYASDFKFRYKEEADECLAVLIDLCDADGWLSVHQFIDVVDPLASAEGRNPYTNHAFGWKNLDHASVKATPERDGYIIDIAPARPK